MPRRSPVGLETISSLDTLSLAFWRASRGQQHTPEVRAMLTDLDSALATLSTDLRAGRAPYSRWTRFTIHDPKRRVILAPCFPDRVLHHAMMHRMAPVLDRALVPDTFACRPDKGTLAAVQRAQHHARRFPVFVQTDVRAYFANIGHARLRGLLVRRFKHPDLLTLCDHVLTRAPTRPGRGLPIGALTSQHFANLYLDGLDRFLLAHPLVRGMVRYMDDVVWWCDDLVAARETLVTVRTWALRERGLTLKPSACIGLSASGLSFLGFRVFPGTLRLSRRRRQRYAAARQRWEGAWRDGFIDGTSLQAGADAALGITAHAEALGWRREQLRRRPAVDA